MAREAPLAPDWVNPDPAPAAPMITTSPATDVPMITGAFAWTARTTSITAAMRRRMPMITWVASNGLENMPIDFPFVGAVPYRL